MLTFDVLVTNDRTVQPTTSEPTTPKPTTLEPTTAEPTTTQKPRTFPDFSDFDFDSNYCPARCCCFSDMYQRLYVDCTDAGYKLIPKLPIKTHFLNMRRNDLRWIETSNTDLSLYRNLIEINLNDNGNLAILRR